MSHTVAVRATPIRSISALEAAIHNLQREGIKVSLQRNAVPRMYYKDQLTRHVKERQELEIKSGHPPEDIFRFNQENPEICEYVVALEDSHYDIALLQDQRGNWTAFFDDYGYGGAHSYSNPRRDLKAIKDILGAKFSGKVEHWSGQKDAGEQQLHSIGRLLQEYTVEAVCEAATAEGYVVSSRDLNAETGEVNITVDVM